MFHNLSCWLQDTRISKYKYIHLIERMLENTNNFGDIYKFLREFHNDGKNH